MLAVNRFYPQDADDGAGRHASLAFGARQGVCVVLPKAHAGRNVPGLYHPASVQRPVARGRGLAWRHRFDHCGQSPRLANHTAHPGWTHLQALGHSGGGRHGGGVAAVGERLGALAFGRSRLAGGQQAGCQGKKKAKKPVCQGSTGKLRQP